jgi:hypothetical protein
MSARQHEHETMERLLRDVNAAGHLDVAITRWAPTVDLIGTDESGERIANLAHAAILDALIHVARAHGWQAPRPRILQSTDPRVHRAGTGPAAISRPGQ